MTTLRIIEITLLTALVIACGPPSADESGPGETDDETTDPDPSETETDTSDDGDFVAKDDIRGLQDCDVILQDCPEGEKCVPYSSTGEPNWDFTKCVPVLGDQGVGEPCTYDGIVEATDDCDATSMCWNVSDLEGEATGTCHAFCGGSLEMLECPEGSQCLISGGSVIAVCIPGCDPLLQDCDDGYACYWANNQFQCIPTLEDIPTGEPCGYINDCAPGNICVPTEVLPECGGMSCCTIYCDIGVGDAQCDAVPGTACVAFFEEGRAPDGYEHIGVCVAP